MEYPNLLELFRLSHPVSLIQTSILGSYIDTSAINELCSHQNVARLHAVFPAGYNP